MAIDGEFVEKFEWAWQDPAARFVELFHPDGTLYQQGMERPLRRDEIPGHIATILTLLPDLRVEVKAWAVNNDDVFIEWNNHATFGDRPISWDGASRFTLRDGLVTEEISYFDTLPLRALVDPSLEQGSMFAAATDALAVHGAA